MARALTSPNEIWIEFLLIFYGITPPSACLPRGDLIIAESSGSLYRQTPPTGKPKKRLLGQVRDSQQKIGQHTMESVGDPLAGRPFLAGQLRRKNAPRLLVAIEPRPHYRSNPRSTY